MKNGSNGERQLANRLDDEGWAVFRVAGSGSAQRPAADLVAVNEEAILVIECKTYKDENKRINVRADVQQLVDLSAMMGRSYNDDNSREEHFIIALKRDGSSVWYYTDAIKQHYITPSQHDDYLTDLLTQYY